MRRILCIALCCLSGCGQKQPTQEELNKSVNDAIPIVKAAQEQAIKAQQQSQSQQAQPSQ
jgi:hypothetical protein